jgi:hypothetical protein
MLRSLVLGRVGRYGDPNIAKEGKRRLDLFIQVPILSQHSLSSPIEI